MPNRIKGILQEYVKGLLKIIGKDLKQVILYGSYARGEQDREEEISDIDIMILVDLDEEDIKKIEKEVIDYSYDLDLKYDILLSPIIDIYHYIPITDTILSEHIFVILIMHL